MAAKTVFIDTNCFCGIYNSKDSLHLKSKKAFRNLKKQKHRLFTSNYIFAEALTILSQRAAKKISIEFGKDIFRQRSLINILTADLSTDLEAFKIFKKVRSKNLSFVDASILALMKKYKVDYLLTFDERLIRLAKKFGFGIL